MTAFFYLPASMETLRLTAGHSIGLSPYQIGVAVGLLASCLQAIGLSLQRKSHVTEERKLSPSEQRSSFKRRRWLVGISIFVVASAVGNVVQLTDVPLPVLIVLQMVSRVVHRFSLGAPHHDRHSKLTCCLRTSLF